MTERRTHWPVLADGIRPNRIRRAGGLRQAPGGKLTRCLGEQFT